jgi:hypothetical protein
LLTLTSCFAGLNIPVAARHKALKDFEAPDMRVILLDLKLGARGL